LIAFLSIVQSKSIRIGYAKFMNDALEMIFADAMINECLLKHSTLFDTSITINTHGRRHYPYVACFSKRPYISEQWCRYADDGHGAAIGFNPNAFRLHEFMPVVDLTAKTDPSYVNFGLSTVVYSRSESGV